jgi:hypothetical protein
MQKHLPIKTPKCTTFMSALHQCAHHYTTLLFCTALHSARCGFLNLYAFDSPLCQIDPMPEIPPENEPCMPNCAPPTTAWA